MRAKLVVQSIDNHATADTLNFRAVYKTDGYPENGLDENNTFSKFTPQADLQMVINNPALVGTFNVGDEFYVDFTKVE